MNKSTRQALTSITALSSAAAWLAVLPAYAAVHALAPQFQYVSSEAARTWSFHAENVLGTSFDMAVSAPSRTAAQSAERAALAEFDRQSRILSAWDSNSEFSRWQRTRGVAVHVSLERPARRMRSFGAGLR